MTLLHLLSGVADACGGFACDRAVPILQSGEQVVIAIDEPAALVDMHVRVAFEGRSSDFAWIVPVPGIPELRLSTAALFDQVAASTAPFLPLTTVEEGFCRQPTQLLPSGGVAYSFSGAPSSTDGGYTVGGVYVLAEQGLGPYETVTLAASSPDLLLEWLQAEGYDLPDDLADVLAPYVSAGQHFVALKLANGQDAGDLQPLALRFPGTRATIPIGLTAISTVDDLPVEVYVFSDGRAVPESYLHTRLNLAAIDWWSGGTNFPRLIGRAADEAGGQSFTTAYHGPASLVPPMWDEAAFDEVALRATSSYPSWRDELAAAVLVPTPELFTVIEDQLGLDAGTGVNAWSCPTCERDESGFEVARATDALMGQVVEPLRTVQALLDAHPKLTTMWTTLDAFEMDTDPTFVVNRDLADEEVAATRRARLTIHCANGKLRDDAPRTLRLEDGREIELRGDDWYERRGTDPFRSLGPMADIAAQVIEQLGPDGEPEVLVDRTDELMAMLEVHNRGIGCRTAPGAGGAAALAGALLLRRRRSAR
jgi:hypothetical protein